MRGFVDEFTSLMELMVIMSNPRHITNLSNFWTVPLNPPGRSSTLLDGIFSSKGST